MQWFDGKRYNEIMGYMINAYFWVLFLVEPQLRCDAVDWLLTRQLDSIVYEFLMDASLWLLAPCFLVCSINVLLLPFLTRPKTVGDREIIATTIVVLNLVSGIVHTIVLWNTAIGLGHAVPLINAAIIVYEITRDEDPIADTDEGEAHWVHLLIATGFIAAFYFYFHHLKQPYWAESLSTAGAVVAVFGFVLTLVVPLDPAGTRLRQRATDEDFHLMQREWTFDRLLHDLYERDSGVREIALKGGRGWKDTQDQDHRRLILLLEGEVLVGEGDLAQSVKAGDIHRVGAGDRLLIENAREAPARFLIAREAPLGGVVGR